VEVAAVDDEVLRHRRQRVLTRSRRTEFHEIDARRRGGRQKFDELEAPVRRARRRPDRGSGGRRPQLGQQRRVLRVHPLARGRQRAVGRRRSDGDERGAAFRRQLDAVERRAGLQKDGVSWLGRVDRGLQVASRGNSDGGSARRGRREQSDGEAEKD